MELTSKQKFIALKASFKGANQAKNFSEKAKGFWANKRQQLVQELHDTLDTSNVYEISQITKRFAEQTGFPELFCDTDEIEKFKRIPLNYNNVNVIEDILEQKSGTTLVTLIGMPAIAAIEGLGDIESFVGEEWLYGIGILHPFSSDIADDFQDKDYKNHSIIPRNEWGICYKIGASAIFDIGQRHSKNVKTGITSIDEEIQRRLEEGITKVSIANKADLEAQNSKTTTIEQIDYIYDWKIGGIEKVVFGTIPSKRRDVADTFATGAWYLAKETQVYDDIKDLNGDAEIPPKIPNPSYFLHFCRERYNRGETDLKNLMLNSANDTLKVTRGFHNHLMIQYENLPNDFSTKPFFKSITAVFNSMLEDEYKKFRSGATIPQLNSQLIKLL